MAGLEDQRLLILSELQGATAVTHCVSGFLLDTEEVSLVIAGPRRLMSYTPQDAENPKDILKLGSSQRPWFDIRSMAVLRRSVACPGHRDLLVVTSDGDLLIMDWNDSTSQFDIILTLPLGRAGYRRQTPAHTLVCDPAGTTVAVLALQTQRVLFSVSYSDVGQPELSAPVVIQRDGAVTLAAAFTGTGSLAVLETLPDPSGRLTTQVGVYEARGSEAVLVAQMPVPYTACVIAVVGTTIVYAGTAGVGIASAAPEPQITTPEERRREMVCPLSPAESSRLIEDYCAARDAALPAPAPAPAAAAGAVPVEVVVWEDWGAAAVVYDNGAVVALSVVGDEVVTHLAGELVNPPLAATAVGPCIFVSTTNGKHRLYDIQPFDETDPSLPACATAALAPLAHLPLAHHPFVAAAPFAPGTALVSTAGPSSELLLAGAALPLPGHTTQAFVPVVGAHSGRQQPGPGPRDVVAVVLPDRRVAIYSINNGVFGLYESVYPEHPFVCNGTCATLLFATLPASEGATVVVQVHSEGVVAAVAGADGTLTPAPALAVPRGVFITHASASGPVLALGCSDGALRVLVAAPQPAAPGAALVPQGERGVVWRSPGQAALTAVALGETSVGVVPLDAPESPADWDDSLDTRAVELECAAVPTDVAVAHGAGVTVLSWPGLAVQAVHAPSEVGGSVVEMKRVRLATLGVHGAHQPLPDPITVTVSSSGTLSVLTPTGRAHGFPRQLPSVAGAPAAATHATLATLAGCVAVMPRSGAPLLLLPSTSGLDLSPSALTLDLPFTAAATVGAGGAVALFSESTMTLGRLVPSTSLLRRPTSIGCTIPGTVSHLLVGAASPAATEVLAIFSDAGGCALARATVSGVRTTELIVARLPEPVRCVTQWTFGPHRVLVAASSETIRLISLPALEVVLTSPVAGPVAAVAAMGEHLAVAVPGGVDVYAAGTLRLLRRARLDMPGTRPHRLVAAGTGRLWVGDPARGWLLAQAWPRRTRLQHGDAISAAVGAGVVLEEIAVEDAPAPAAGAALVDSHTLLLVSRQGRLTLTGLPDANVQDLGAGLARCGKHHLIPMATTQLGDLSACPVASGATVFVPTVCGAVYEVSAPAVAPAAAAALRALQAAAPASGMGAGAEYRRGTSTSFSVVDVELLRGVCADRSLLAGAAEEAGFSTEEALAALTRVLS